MTTITEVAKKAGVSKSTVSNVFSKKRPIGAAVTKRVLEAARELNYRPTYWSRRQGQQHTRTIGLLLNDEGPLRSFQLALLGGIMRACREFGYRLLVNTVPSAWTVEPAYIAESAVNGEIVLDPTQPDARIEERLKQGMPMVIIGRPPMEYAPHLSSVDNDNIGAAQQLTDYLLERGHREIGFLNAPCQTTVAAAREAGYRLAFASRGIPVREGLLHHRIKEQTVGELYALAQKMLQSAPEITAILTDSSLEAGQIYRAAAHLGIAIPARLSVAAFLNEGGTPALKPALTFVNLHEEALGFEAAKLLIDRCERRGERIKQIAINTTLEIRDSCTSPH